MTERKKLIEVSLPLEAINRESAREKSIRFGHPSTLHLWWARRPLAACRAVIFASLVDDPSARPDRFPTEGDQERERQRLFQIIERLVSWDNVNDRAVLDEAQREIEASTDGDPPAVYDPFCGGGSIPLEAQRLGLDAHASDLNPVAVLITKAMIELPPHFAGSPPVHTDVTKLQSTGSWPGARGLADDVRFYGDWMRSEAEKRIGHLYPKVAVPAALGGGTANVIAWLWARTVPSPNPAWGGSMPLVRSFALSTKKGNEVWIEPTVDRDRQVIHFAVRTGPGCPDGTVNRTGAVCLATGTPVPLSYIRAEAQQGRMGRQLIGIVADGPRGRIYLPPSEIHENVADVAPPWMPEEEVTTPSHDVDRLPMYGMRRWGDAFTDRQLVLLTTLVDLLSDVKQQVMKDARESRPDPAGYASAIVTYLALGISRLADISNTLCRWGNTRTQVRNLYSKQAISMVWDYAENNPFAGAAGDYAVSLGSVVRVLERLGVGRPGVVTQLDASQGAAVESAMVCTDPPYYDNVGYADLSDFFYVWLRRALRDEYPLIFSTIVTPKSPELTAMPHRFGGKRALAEAHFEAGLRKTFDNMRAVHDGRFPLTVFYAFKQSEARGDGGTSSTGWETMLEGLLGSQLTIQGTWPIRTELANKVSGQGANMLASSIVLVCRPRSQGAPLATRKDFVSALRSELPLALRRLQQGSIAPVDLAQSAIGPGMAVFSRYAKVVEADGTAMGVRAALTLINQVLDETLSEQEGDFDSDTRWAVSWFEQHGMTPGPFGSAETLSKAKNTAVNSLVTAGIVESKGGKVRLRERSELADAWEPGSDARLTVWEIAHYLIRALETGGESSAADLLRQVGGLGETARELAYRLYMICERKKWAQEATAYNSLVIAWPELVRQAALTADGAPQGTLLG